MKVSILIDNFNKETMILQPWNYAYRIASVLAYLGNDITLFTNQQSDISSALSLSGEVPIQDLPVSSLRFLNERSLDIIKQKRPDVIYLFGNSLSGIYVKRARCLQIPIVLHISAMHYSYSELRSLSLHDAFSHWVHIATSIPPGNFLVHLLDDDAITIITVPSKAIKDRLSEFGVSNEKIKVAPLAFDAKNLVLGDSKTMLNARVELGLEKESFIATYLGSPDTIRGTDILIHSASILKSNLRNLKIIILSRRDSNENNKDERLLHQLVRKYDLDNVVKIVPGILSKEMVKSCLLASDVVVLPFKIIQSEPPLAILEAMALGKPVVATKTCGLPEIVDFDRGLLVRPGDAKDLAEALYYLAGNPEMVAKLGRQARDFVLNLPNFDRLGKWTREILYQAVQEQKDTSK